MPLYIVLTCDAVEKLH